MNRNLVTNNMKEKFAFGEPQLFIGNKPLPLHVNVDSTPLVDNCDPHNKFEDAKRLNEVSRSISFDIPMTKELEKLSNELFDDFSRSYEDYLRQVDAAITKILTEYIDEPFTKDWKEATKEDFEKRHINALVYQDMADGLQAFVGVLQGTTLICVNGERIENFQNRVI